jgi:GTPase SAR1 family protein
MSLAFQKNFESIRNLLIDAEELAKDVVATAPEFGKSLTEALQRLESQGPLQVTLIGEFNAGKSSIISALTGEEILIDADVATQAISHYPWRGLTLVDTPGVQRDSVGTDHDQIAREATVGADLVLFVITNELFTPRLSAHLRFLLANDGLGLARKTCVLVNKMDRENNPDEHILQEVGLVLAPHQDVPIFLCAAGKFLAAERLEGLLRERFMRQSRFAGLIHGLNDFVAQSGTQGRLTTPLQIAIETLDGIESGATGSEDDKKELELLRRQKVILHRLQGRLLEIRRTWKQSAFSSVMKQANKALECITELTEGRDLEEIFESTMKQAVSEVEAQYDSVETDLAEAMSRAAVDLEELGGSPLGLEAAKIELNRAQSSRPTFGEEREKDSNHAAKILKSAAKPLQEGLEAAAKNSKGLRDTVYNTGKALGKKFRPYEAVKGGEKLAKVAGKLGKAMPFIAAGVDYYLQCREEKAEEDRARYLAKARINLRNAFAEQAKLESEALETAVMAIYRERVQNLLESLDRNAEEITGRGQARTAFGIRIAQLKRTATALRDELYSA